MANQLCFSLRTLRLSREIIPIFYSDFINFQIIFTQKAQSSQNIFLLLIFIIYSINLNSFGTNSKIINSPSESDFFSGSFLNVATTNISVFGLPHSIRIPAVLRL